MKWCQIRIAYSEEGQISDVDHSLSGEDCIPDLESQDDDSDTSIPLMSSQSRDRRVTEKTGIPNEGTSYGSDTDIQVWPSTFKFPSPLEEHVSPNAAKTSHLGTSTKGASKEKPKDDAQP